ncbi:MAG: hypothetical protein LQ352_006214, partial [Teloschistes flavicans]
MPRFHLTEKGTTSQYGKGDHFRDAVAHTVRYVRPQHGGNKNRLRSFFGFGRGGRRENGNAKARFPLESPILPHNDAASAYHHAESPMSLQQIRFSPEGSEQASVREEMYVENRDPYRADEYQSVSTRESSEPTDDTFAVARPRYVNASTQWSRGSSVRPSGDAEGAAEGDEANAYAPALAGPSHDAVLGEAPARTYKAYKPYVVSPLSSSSSYSSSERDLDHDAAPLDQHFDAEAHLHQIIRQKSREYDLVSVAQDSSLPPSPLRPRQGGNKPDERAERRFGRIFDGDVDYSRFSTAGKFEVAGGSDSATQQPASVEERQARDIPSHPLSQSRSRPPPRYTHAPNPPTLSNVPASPLVPARRALPRAPPPTTQRIP